MITTVSSIVVQPSASRWLDKVSPRLPMMVAPAMQAMALAWIGLFFRLDRPLAEMAISLAIMVINVGMELLLCNICSHVGRGHQNDPGWDRCSSR